MNFRLIPLWQKIAAGLVIVMALLALSYCQGRADGKAGMEVKIANARGVELPAAPPRALRRDIEKLGKRNGAEFDREYVREVGIKAHEKDIKLFQKASKDVKDAELKAFVDKTLPTLQEHLAAAHESRSVGADVNPTV